MAMTTLTPRAARFAFLSLLLLPAGCVGAPGLGDAVAPVAYSAQDQECLARAMYFESNRSSEEGMLAVGTVVMNRVESDSYPGNVCSVVGQPRQFAPGVMTRPMGAGKELAMATAARVLQGERHASVEKAKFFHTAGLSFGYGNMNYKAIAGGNAFYEKVSPRRNPGFKFTSQADVRAAQRTRVASTEASSAKTGRVVTAHALAEREERPVSPFAALWKNLTTPHQDPRPAPVSAVLPAASVGETASDAATASLPASPTSAPTPTPRPEPASLPGVAAPGQAAPEASLALKKRFATVEASGKGARVR